MRERSLHQDRFSSFAQLFCLVLVEKNARKGLEFADASYVLVARRLVKAGPDKELLADPDMGRLFLGG